MKKVERRFSVEVSDTTMLNIGGEADNKKDCELLFINNKAVTITTRQHTFSKEERLKSRKLIEHLFSNGKSISVFPIKVLYSFVENGSAPLQAGVTTSSRKFRKAVQRNRVKRILREAYRLQKLSLMDSFASQGKFLALFFIYTGKDLPVYSEVYEKMGVILKRLNEAIKSNTAKS